MVYVDRLRDWGWRLGPSCHMIADCEAELHAFAASIGLRRSWFQSGRNAHYDLTVKRRASALKKGAVELDDRAFHAVLARNREKG